MALSRLLALTSSACPADIFATPVVATTVSTAAHLSRVLVGLLKLHGMRSPAISPPERSPWARFTDLYLFVGHQNAEMPAACARNIEAGRQGRYPNSANRYRL